METPFFYYDRHKIISNVRKYDKRKFKLNYSVKACLFEDLINVLEPFVDGFSVSSLAEIRDVRQYASETKKAHFISPMITKKEVDEITPYGGHSIAFNSIEQLNEYKHRILEDRNPFFIRIDPEHSIIEDERYNPCRQYSKLGVLAR